jgi:ABC-2 type transport system permease protein
VVFQIQEEVKDGTLAYNLLRPYSYVLFQVSRSMGESLVKMLPILAEGFVLAFLFVGPLPNYLAALPFGLILIVGGLLLNTLWHVNIGLLAFWFEEVSPFLWILQKFIFILGGLFFPINFFPGWLQGICKYLPFAYSAYWPAYTMVDFSTARFFSALAGTVCYLAILLLISSLLFGLARKRVHVQGG